jgi:hypothetical protein
MSRTWPKLIGALGGVKGTWNTEAHENSSMKVRRWTFGWDDFSIFVVPIARMPDFCAEGASRQAAMRLDRDQPGTGGMGLDFVEVRRNCLRSINARRGHWPEGECRLARATDAGAA